MRATVVGRTYLLRANQAKWHYLPKDVSLSLITPPYVRHTFQTYTAERSNLWPHAIVPAAMMDRLSGFVFSPLPLAMALREARPDLVQVDEEPASLALLEVLLLKRRLGFPVVFFTWENLVTRYPAPFNQFRQLALRWADGAIAGNQGAADLLAQAGFRKPVAVIPQLGIDPQRSFPQRAEDLRSSLGLTKFTIGFAGRLVAEKGVLTLLEALQGLKRDWQWLIVGDGPLRGELEQRSRMLGMDARLRWAGTVPHADVPRHINAMDVLVLPSQSTPRWKEQLGHVLLDAMACGVPVIGSDCGAIPEVIGNAGLVFPEGQASALVDCLQRLHDDPALRQMLGQLGRERALAHYTHQRIAERTVAFWRKVRSCA